MSRSPSSPPIQQYHWLSHKLSLSSSLPSHKLPVNSSIFFHLTSNYLIQILFITILKSLDIPLTFCPPCSLRYPHLSLLSSRT
uniref:Uncharacterized protein n=1 Tax=Rhizophora mucronata TaxID=61149 RepID=A0A2P2N358_RHIMU